ncbi:MAG TPA: hypothetical protein VL728_01125 [Cyclobacteriaceae bacterium]|jgi:hypothetical protein|nr:hypothetical protein [Cyclobacteriaceae bacterium]
MNLIQLKKDLHLRCLEIINQRMAAAKQAMDDAQDSANQEDKNSAGDKYETGRAMAQIARDQAAQQLDEALQLKNVLDRLASLSASNKITLGSLVITDESRFYVSVSIGKIIVEEKEYLVISPHSPIGKMLMNRSVGADFIFNQRKQIVRAIY